MTGIPFKMTLVLGEGENRREIVIDGHTPVIKDGNLLNDRTGFAHGADCLLGCSKSLAEAGSWVAWQSRAEKRDMQRCSKETM